MIDVYCERIGPDLWAEPLNAITNLSFIVAAVFAWRLARRRDVLRVDIAALVFLILAIGVGSFLFHTFATRWAMFMDVLPILGFQIAYLWSYGTRIIALSVIGRLLAIAGLVAGLFIVAQFVHLMNGSLSYLPAFLVLLFLSIYHYRHAPVRNRELLIAAGLFALSLTFRTIDQAVCDHLVVGTHLLWHLLNGLVLFLVMRALITNFQPAGHPV